MSMYMEQKLLRLLRSCVFIFILQSGQICQAGLPRYCSHGFQLVLEHSDHVGSCAAPLYDLMVGQDLVTVTIELNLYIFPSVCIKYWPSNKPSEQLESRKREMGGVYQGVHLKFYMI